MLLLLAAVAVLVAALVVVLVARDSGNGNQAAATDVLTPSDPTDTGFTFNWPKNWQAVAQSKLPKPAAGELPVTGAIQRRDGLATIVVSVAANSVQEPKQLANDLDAQLKSRLKDYKPVAGYVLTLPAGRAFFFAYERTKQGTLNTLTVLPVGQRSYVFNAVLPTSNEAIANEISGIMRSIRVTTK